MVHPLRHSGCPLLHRRTYLGQFLPKRSKDKVVRQAVKQGSAECRFQPLQAPADCRYADAQHPRRLGQGAAARDLQE